MKKELSCFKSYDVRGKIGEEIDQEVCYSIGRAFAQFFEANAIVIAFDARETSPVFANYVKRGVCDAGSDVIMIGLAGTEEMYSAVTEFSACSGIEITASHNPINYNGMKFVKSGSRPLDIDQEFNRIKSLAENRQWIEPLKQGEVFEMSKLARKKYIDRILEFIDISKFAPKKILINCGNGAAGPTIRQLTKRLHALGAPLEFIIVDEKPDCAFPNGIPNPLLPENQSRTSDLVRSYNVDIGIAFDGDFDRCFFFDNRGNFIPGEYIVGIIASIFLEKEPGSAIVYDPRVIWNTLDIINNKGGKPIQSKTGHAHIKSTMRQHNAIYGGEMSAHHYFRDFSYCDSGMIPWLIIVEFISQSSKSVFDIFKKRFEKFPSSGEYNFKLDNPDESIQNLLRVYNNFKTIDRTDGISLEFEDWRFNVRKSNTEPLVRLNVETKGQAKNLNSLLSDIKDKIMQRKTE